MKEHVKDAWLAWLRDPNNKQGYGRLTTRDAEGDADCCLGGLCKLYIAASYELPTVEHDYGDHKSVRYGGYDDGTSTALPQEVRCWAGMGSELGNLPIAVDDATNLVQLNDGARENDQDVARYTFAQIADVIELHWREL